MNDFAISAGTASTRHSKWVVVLVADSCRELFINASNCKINPPAAGVDSCIRDKTMSWYDDNKALLDSP
jgi:hypothetical protein